MLTITSCEPRHEPGFSRSECLELARRFEIGNALGQIHCENWDCEGHVDSDKDLTPRQRDTIIAALRTYAR